VGGTIFWQEFVEANNHIWNKSREKKNVKVKADPLGGTQEVTHE
jgi:hypothetical protein